ncbi:MAG: DUF1993 domain-containing protein [Deltaproteobacteria bacterium]|nr:DUF1993 domain-containing protein [Deltaproteobacteria bacterium]
MNLYDATVPIFTKHLRAIDKWLDKAVALADQKKFDPEVLLNARLAPDQYPFLRQIQSACDQAKWACAKMCGKEGPAHPDNEKTVADLRARLKTVVEYLATFKPEDFTGAEERPVRHGYFPEGKHVRGGDYLDHLALPNFHFHLTTAYAILRHNGVELGKFDYLSEVPFK